MKTDGALVGVIDLCCFHLLYPIHMAMRMSMVMMMMVMAVKVVMVMTMMIFDTDRTSLDAWFSIQHIPHLHSANWMVTEEGGSGGLL